MDEQEAWTRFEAWRWPNGPDCPHCPALGYAQTGSRLGQLQCGDCGKAFRAASGTPLAGSHLPLGVWLDVLAELHVRPQTAATTLARDLGQRIMTMGALVKTCRDLLKDAAWRKLARSLA